jgi:hypothetical protein
LDELRFPESFVKVLEKLREIESIRGSVVFRAPFVQQLKSWGPINFVAICQAKKECPIALQREAKPIRIFSSYRKYIFYIAMRQKQQQKIYRNVFRYIKIKHLVWFFLYI